MKPALALALPLVACTHLDDTPPPIFVIQNPLCIVFCLPQVGSVREDVTGFGAPATGGAQSLGQSQSAAAGGIAP